MDIFRKLLTKEQIFTIPNIMSLFRIVLIPFIIWIYVRDSYDVAAALVVISALTDILDGIIARKFNMVSDLGKVLDPVCDKLTHVALLICLITRYPQIWRLLVLLLAKELIVATLGAIAVKRREKYHSARWYGKLCTVVFESSMILLMLIPNMPWKIVITLVALCTAVMVFALVMYAIFFICLIVGKRKD